MRHFAHGIVPRGLLAVLAALLIVTIGAAPRSDLAPAAEAQQRPTIARLLGLTESNRLVRFDSDRPGVILGVLPITGLAGPDETIVGIDVRPANGMLYGASRTRLYSINPSTGAATQVGSGTFDPPLDGTQFGFDFNPVPDRIRVVSDTRQNLRLNPETGAVAAVDGQLSYAVGDVQQGATPRVAAAAYTNSFAGSTATTNYAIDFGRGMLVTQGSVNGAPVSPNTGTLFSVGPLGFASTEAIGFDISMTGVPFVSLTSPGAGASTLYSINLQTGAATLIGAIGGGEVLRGFTVLP